MSAYRFDYIARKAGLIAELPTGPVRRRFICERCGVELMANVCRCETCAAAEQVEKRAALIVRARESIPQRFRWARLTAPALAKRLKASPKVVETAWHALSGANPIVTIVGQSGTGKTSLAVAMLAEIIEAGAVLTCDPKVLDRARFAHFAGCQQLAIARKEHKLGAGAPDEVMRARRASVLVLDEVGREGKGELDVAKIIHEREADCALTIVTTWLDEGGALAAYDSGLARRLFRKSILFELGGAK